MGTSKLCHHTYIGRIRTLILRGRMRRDIFAECLLTEWRFFLFNSALLRYILSGFRVGRDGALKTIMPPWTKLRGILSPCSISNLCSPTRTPVKKAIEDKKAANRIHRCRRICKTLDERRKKVVLEVESLKAEKNKALEGNRRAHGQAERRGNGRRAATTSA